jgi:hypothetical protein
MLERMDLVRLKPMACAIEPQQPEQMAFHLPLARARLRVNSSAPHGQTVYQVQSRLAHISVVAQAEQMAFPAQM